MINIVYPNTTYANIFTNLPGRSDTALSGSAFFQSIIDIPPGQQRDDLFFNEIVSGNVPNRMRSLIPVNINENGNSLIYWITGDYCSIGSDDDYIRLPMDGKLAKRIVDFFGGSCITKKMSDQIWQAADLKLNPQNLPPTSAMITTQYALDHNRVIEQQRNGRDFRIIDGIKKDVIIDKALLINVGKLGIFGWRFLNGQAIQGPMPNCSSHDGHLYSDYSQSLRIVSQKVSLNGQNMDFFDILEDANYCYLISEQGTYNARNIYT